MSKSKLGYLLPTREQIMEGKPETGPLLKLAEKAGSLGFDSIWVGDSLTARPRHDPLTLLAAVAGRIPGITIGTAVLLPALRNPVLLAHQVATLDQLSEGRLILGVGLAADRPNIRAEFAAAGVPFDLRIGRMMEGLRLCKALWSPSAPDFATGLAHVRAVADSHGRDSSVIDGAMYLTISLDDDAAKADDRLNRFLEGYYGVPAAATRRRQAAYAGSASGLAEWLDSYARAGAGHLILRFAGDHDRHLDAVARIRLAS